MAITFQREGTFTQQRKRDQVLIIMLFGAMLATSLILWQGFFQKGAVAPASPAELFPVKKVEIRFDVFEGPALEALNAKPPPSALPQTIGRANPFLPF